jgi:hypothetical protein
MSLEHLDAWQSRVFGLELPLQTVTEPWCVTRGRIRVVVGPIPDLQVGGLRLWDLGHDSVTQDTYLILDDGSKVCLTRLWNKGVPRIRRDSLEETISCMYSSNFSEDSLKASLASIVRRLDFTGRCLRMLQRYPEGVLGWVEGDDMKPFRVLVYEMFLEGV